MAPEEFQDYRRKIRTAEEVAEIVGPRPRQRKVIMCHGVFDVVHPGHIRHLLYAKSKADVLVASLTCDAHVTKGEYRPYVPDDLRAMNLAVLEVVDYVVIDREAKPLKNIATIEPDYFAKGYEYGDGGMPPETREETVALEAFGGEMIFTPGDIVYSSTAIIDMGAPSISAHKLAMLMEMEEVSFADLSQTLDKLKGVRVHVIGDTIVDSYTRGGVIGSSGKTPTISVRYEGRTDYAGGAAIVCKHLAAAGADVTFSTILGDDAFKDFVLDDLEKAGVTCKPIVDATRPTTNKNVFIADGYRLLKLDTLDNSAITGRVVEQMEAAIADTPADAVVFSDFRHGIFSRRTVNGLIAAIPEGTFRVADSQVASRWGNILEFEGFDLITPNEREARFALGDQDTGVRPLGYELYRQAKCKTLIMKLGERGVITYRSRLEDDYRAFFVIDSFTQNAVDPVGAGDALLAYATLAMVATGDKAAASILGSFAAAIECEYDGNVPVTPDKVLEKAAAVEKQINFG